MKKTPTCFIPIRGEVWPIVLVWPRNLSTEMPVPSQEESDHVYTYVCVCVSTLSHLCVCLCIDFVSFTIFPLQVWTTLLVRHSPLIWLIQWIHLLQGHFVSLIDTMNTFITRSFRILLQWIHLLQGNFVSWYNEYIYYKVISYLVTIMYFLLQDIKQYLISQQKFYPIQ